jgi:hypothetical protein
MDTELIIDSFDRTEEAEKLLTKAKVSFEPGAAGNVLLVWFYQLGLIGRILTKVGIEYQWNGLSEDAVPD